MPTKVCACGREYWARWRNTPAVCEECVLRVIVCPDCWRVTRASDPAQLSLFYGPEAVGRRRLLPATLAAHFANVRPRHFDHETHVEELLTTTAAKHPTDAAPWPKRASRAERQRHPLH